MSYPFLLALHSCTRWLVVFSLVWAILLSAKGYWSKSSFDKKAQITRVVMVSLIHLQAVIGFCLYFASPIIKYFMKNFGATVGDLNICFFGIIHALLMTIAVVVVTIGAALAKRAEADAEKFRLLLVYSIVTFVIIFIAVPWPFSPLAQRVWFRPF
jgi:hypothetical protein